MMMFFFALYVCTRDVFYVRVMRSISARIYRAACPFFSESKRWQIRHIFFPRRDTERRETSFFARCGTRREREDTHTHRERERESAAQSVGFFVVFFF